MNHLLYSEWLETMFVFWNSVRILTYLPTIWKLIRAGGNARSHSLVSWICWALSNGTFALMLLERNSGDVDAMTLMTAGNAAMCLLVSMIIAKQRGRQTTSPTNDLS